MSAQLATLQTELASVKAMLTEDRRRPPRSVWVLAIILLCGSAGLVVIGIHMGLLASQTAAFASRLQAEAHTDLARSEQAIQPVISLEHRKGAAWVDHATKLDVNDTTSSLLWAKAV